ncbi:uncharacterized protein LOC114182981 [Vigna unguiculata]|uniref:uncharacterized protein LOC114182981 n=1 Tax=Vigna unguiculata TaxID=3917 RepID=UPI001016531C|nr:uncharacterized protein LOC114182981 [Vigna unguiculata]
MSQTQSSSSYCNNCMQRSVPASRTQALRPICDCGQAAVLRTTRTPRNVGRKLWGCANYKRQSEGGGVCCNFFKWWYEDVDEEKEVIIVNQNMKIEDLENVVRDLKKCFNVLAVVVSIVGLINVVMLALMLKD